MNTPAGPVEGGGWRLELDVGRGYEENVRPAPPDSLPPPPSGSLPPPGALPPPPSASLPPPSPGNDHFNKLQLAAGWHYRSPVSSPGAGWVDWPTRVQAMLTRYDNFSTSNRDEFVVDTLPGWIKGDNETRLFTHLMKTAVDGDGFSQEYSLRLLQTKMVRPPFGIAFGVDRWEQQFDYEQISLQQDHRRHRLLAGVVGRFSPQSGFSFLTATGRDDGLQERDNYDVWGLELFATHTAMNNRLRMLFLAEYEKGDAVQTSGMTLERRKINFDARYRVHSVWQIGVGYKLDDIAVGNDALPASESYEVTFGLAF